MLHHFKDQMAKLPPLRVPHKPIGLGHPTGSVAIGDAQEGQGQELGNLARKTAELLKVRTH